jgi:uncharacterized protein YndB with AHSA1/START domain
MTEANRSKGAVAARSPSSARLATDADAHANGTADRELVATRVLDAPRELVFKVWTDPDHIGQWWGPRGFSTTSYTMDVRPGSVWRFCMHGPDGVDYQNKITYLEVVEPERLVYKHGGDEDCEPVNFQVTVTFEDQGGKTRLTMRMVFPSPEERDSIIEKYRADEGLIETLDRLGEYTAAMARSKRSALTVTLPTDREILLTRVFEAPRWLVFEAITRPEHVVRWWGYHGMTLTIEEMDIRPGGAWRFVLRAPDGQVYPFKGVYREVVPPERVVSTFIYDVEVIRDFESIETLTLEEQNGKTTMTVRILHQSKEARDGHLQSGMEAGAAQSYDRLAELLRTLA